MYYAVLECDCREYAIAKLLVTVVKTERGRPEDGGWVARMAGNDKEERAMERLADSGTVCAAICSIYKSRFVNILVVRTRRKSTVNRNAAAR